METLQNVKLWVNICLCRCSQKLKKNLMKKSKLKQSPPPKTQAQILKNPQKPLTPVELRCRKSVQKISLRINRWTNLLHTEKFSL